MSNDDSDLHRSARSRTCRRCGLVYDPWDGVNPNVTPLCMECLSYRGLNYYHVSKREEKAIVAWQKRTQRGLGL